MNSVQINIPSRNLALDAADIVIDTFRTNDINPHRAYRNPAYQSIALA